MIYIHISESLLLKFVHFLFSFPNAILFLLELISGNISAYYLFLFLLWLEFSTTSVYIRPVIHSPSDEIVYWGLHVLMWIAALFFYQFGFLFANLWTFHSCQWNFNYILDFLFYQVNFLMLPFLGLHNNRIIINFKEN